VKLKQSIKKKERTKEKCNLSRKKTVTAHLENEP
jgi:hypothetical protein